jgi:hypothetical protein
MAIHYYLTVFPMEALIASQHEPEHFGTYMATGTRDGSSEQLIFIELDPSFEGFDWEYAKTECVPHPDGRPKNSVYLSIYRVLEQTPMDALGDLYLTTRDGRTLALPKDDYDPSVAGAPYHVYQELCPVNPLVVSKLAPREFGQYITGPKTKLQLPKIVFADLKVVDLNNLEDSGNIGALYDRNTRHLQRCVESVTCGSPKATKTLERSHVESFTFNIIKSGIYVGDGTDTITYKMPTLEELRASNYDWARSAQII